MTNPSKLRQRKKESTPSKILSRVENHDRSHSRTRTLTLSAERIAYGILLIGFVIYSYLNPVLIRGFFDNWIGFSDHWEIATPGVSSEGRVEFFIDGPKRKAVVEAFRHAWLSYERDAMGADEYHPISRKGSNLTAAGGIGYTVVDAIDTMMLMGLDHEYMRIRKWLTNKLSFDRDANFNTFETTIRVLGGLLSAYHFSGGDKLYLEKAIELADRMLLVFETPSGLPLSMINLATQIGMPNTEYPELVSTAEVSTLQLELRYLSHLTGNEVYWKKAERVMAVIKTALLPHGLASVFMSPEDGQFVTSAIRLGSRGDSYYEYLLKQYLQTNGTEDVYRDMYTDAMQAIHNHLIHQSTKTRLTYTAELIPEKHPNDDISWRLTPKQDHLVCFLGGSLMLGATTTGALVHPVSIPPKPEELSEAGMRDWKTGAELIKTCMRTHDTATGLSPEIVHFRIPSDGMDESPYAPEDWYIKGARLGEFPPYDARYMLRPETIESLFIAYRLTGDLQYRNSAWNIFQAIEKHCKVETGGYATIINVDEVPSRMEDKMETFFLSETLKYLYLIFSDDKILPLDKYVFNTEAHPLPIFNPTIRTSFA